jgi:HSP20 family protein
MIVRTRPLLDRSFDRAFDQLASSFFDFRSSGPVVDATWNGDQYILTVDLPGVPASAVAIEVSGNMLSMSADTPNLHWKRSIRLGGQLDPEKVSANHVDGRLTVTIGTVDEPAARRVEISTERPAIEASTTDTTASEADTNEFAASPEPVFEGQAGERAARS